MNTDTMEKLMKETYMKAVENSVGTRMFNSAFVRTGNDGKVVDIMDDGMYSCAFFVSSVLYLFGMIDTPHATVESTRESMEQDSRWSTVDGGEIEKGDVVFWEKIQFDDGSENAHVGFAISNTEAVSTDYKQKMIARHPLKSETVSRNIEAVYRYTW